MIYGLFLICAYGGDAVLDATWRTAWHNLGLSHAFRAELTVAGRCLMVEVDSNALALVTGTHVVAITGERRHRLPWRAPLDSRHRIAYVRWSKDFQAAIVGDANAATYLTKKTQVRLAGVGSAWFDAKGSLIVVRSFNFKNERILSALSDGRKVSIEPIGTRTIGERKLRLDPSNGRLVLLVGGVVKASENTHSYMEDWPDLAVTALPGGMSLVTFVNGRTEDFRGAKFIGGNQAKSANNLLRTVGEDGGWQYVGMALPKLLVVQSLSDGLIQGVRLDTTRMVSSPLPAPAFWVPHSNQTAIIEYQPRSTVIRIYQVTEATPRRDRQRHQNHLLPTHSTQ